MGERDGAETLNELCQCPGCGFIGTINDFAADLGDVGVLCVACGYAGVVADYDPPSELRRLSVLRELSTTIPICGGALAILLDYQELPNERQEQLF